MSGFTDATSLTGHDDAERAQVVAKAVARAGDRLGLKNNELAEIVGYSASTVTRLKKGKFWPDPNSKQYELCVQFLRLYRSLDAFAGGNLAWAEAWLRQPNLGLAGVAPEAYAKSRGELKELGRVPLPAMKTIEGLYRVTDYLDARRAHS